MAEKDFYDWFEKEAKGHIHYVLNNNVNLSQNIPKQNAFTLYALYLQKKLFNQTRRLVWATWFLAIATIILSFLTLILR